MGVARYMQYCLRIARNARKTHAYLGIAIVAIAIGPSSNVAILQRHATRSRVGMAFVLKGAIHPEQLPKWVVLPRGWVRSLQ